MMNDENKLQVQESEVLSLAAMEAVVENRMKLVDKMQEILNRHIDPAKDINMVYGNICRNINFAKKAYRIFGGRFEFVKDVQGIPVVLRKEMKDEQGSYYVYEAFGKYSPPFGAGDVIEASGMFSSRDEFFGKTNEGFKPTSEVNEQNVRQAAQSECFKKCIFTALGMSAITDEDAAKAGIDMAKVVGYKGKVKGTQGGNTLDAKEMDKLGLIESMCQELYKSGVHSPLTQKPFVSPEEVLKIATTSDKFTGWDGFKKISPKGMNITHKNVQEFVAKMETLPM